MNSGLIIAIASSAAVLLVYGLIERKLNHRACPLCGFRVSRENPGGCPRCARIGSTEAVAAQHPGRKLWPTVTLIALPICIIVVDAAVILKERSQSPGEVALRIVKESVSRKENFTVQQYLYATIYHRKDAGEGIQILGWAAHEPATGSNQVVVTFTYSDGGTAKVAVWDVDLDKRKVSPTNDAARELSWD
jgi:hypothetical protein